MADSPTPVSPLDAPLLSWADESVYAFAACLYEWVVLGIPFVSMTGLPEWHVLAALILLLNAATGYYLLNLFEDLNRRYYRRIQELRKEQLPTPTKQQ